jgi:hypothetical protein
MRFHHNIALFILYAAAGLLGMECTDTGENIIQSPNHAPEITSPVNVITTVGQRLLYRALATDPDGDPTTISLSNLPSWLSTSADSVFGVTPDSAADSSFQIIASDGSLADTALVSITIGTTNRPPVVTSSDTASAVENSRFVYHASATDPDGTTPTISFANHPSWLTPSFDSLHGQTPSGAVDTSFIVIASDDLMADTLTVSIDIIAGVSYSAQIQPVFDVSCALAGCHGMGMNPPYGLRLMSYQHLMDTTSHEPVIIPYDPDNSLLVKRIEGAILPRMPLNGPPYLPDSTIQLIRTWVTQGASDN